MTTAAKESLLLVVLLAVLAAVVAYQMRAPAPASGAGETSNPSNAAPAPDGAAPEVVTDVQLELLASEPAAFTPPRRDPFRFRAAAQPPPAAATAREPTPGPPPPPPGPPPRPPISASIRLLGIYQMGDRRVAVLHDGSLSGPIHGVEGETIQGQYRLVRVLPNAVELAYVDGGPPQRIPLPGR